MLQGKIIAINGNLYEYGHYDEDAKRHIAYIVEVDENGILTATYDAYAFTDEELKDNAVNFTKWQWYGIVEHFIRQDYEGLSDDDIANITGDIIERCFTCGVPTLEELSEYIAEYMNR